jgi:hypothetical protein
MLMMSEHVPTSHACHHVATHCLNISGAYAPSIIMAESIRTYRSELALMGMATLSAMNKTNNLWVNDTQWWNGAVASPMKYNGSRLGPQITKMSAALKAFTGMPKEYIDERRVLWYTAQTNLLFANYSLTMIGQNNGSSAIANNVTAFRKPLPKQ